MGLDTVELVLRTEETFSIDLPDNECSQIVSVGDLYRAILAKLDLPYVPSTEVEDLGRNRAIARYPQITSWTTPDVWRTLKGIIVDQLQIDDEEVRESARFLADLGCD